MPLKDHAKKRAYDNALRARNPERIRARDRANYAANRERKLAYQRDWRLKKVVDCTDIDEFDQAVK